jgi:hypothetical protein
MTKMSWEDRQLDAERDNALCHAQQQSDFAFSPVAVDYLTKLVVSYWFHEFG